jgi:hypothetical protein
MWCGELKVCGVWVACVVVNCKISGVKLTGVIVGNFKVSGFTLTCGFPPNCKVRGVKVTCGVVGSLN